MSDTCKHCGGDRTFPDGDALGYGFSPCSVCSSFEMRFRTLWATYRATLSQPFGKTREDDGRITASVDAAFQALDQLSKEEV